MITIVANVEIQEYLDRKLKLSLEVNIETILLKMGSLQFKVNFKTTTQYGLRNSNLFDLKLCISK